MKKQIKNTGTRCILRTFFCAAAGGGILSPVIDRFLDDSLLGYLPVLLAVNISYVIFWLLSKKKMLVFRVFINAK
jgi:hypothetical protein